MSTQQNPALVAAAAFILVASSSPAQVVFSESFEAPVVSGFDDNTVPAGANWIGSSQGFGSSNRGLYNETVAWPATPPFTTPYGDQAYYLNYTNSGLTTAQGVTGQTLTAGITYTVTFNTAVTSGTASASYDVELVAFGPADDNNSRKDLTGAGVGTILASASGTTTTDDMSDAHQIVFTPDGSNPHLGKELGIRLDKASGSMLYDNIRLIVGHDLAPNPADGEDLDAGGNVALSWTNMPPNAPATDTPVDVWFGPDPGSLTQVVDGQITATTMANAPTAGTWHWRVDSYPDGDPEGTPVTGQVFVFTIADTDGDGLPDEYELEHTDPASNVALDPASDLDSDDLTAAQEYDFGTDPNDADSDDDNLNDGPEINGTAGLRPATNPLLADTDGDGLDDDVETNTGVWVNSSDTGTNPVDADWDDDGLVDGVETNDDNYVDQSATGSDPYVADSDADGVTDWYEVTAAFTDPNNASDKPPVPYPLPDPDASPGATDKPVKVYIMSGQSNMFGYGRISSGTYTLDMMVNGENKFPNLVDESGEWTTRQDVRFRGVISDISKVQLSPATLDPVDGQFGPELGFGYIMGWYHDEPVLLLKSCTGNRGLGWDILPPGSPSYDYGGEIFAGYGEGPAQRAIGEDPATDPGWWAGREWDRFFTDESEWVRPQAAAENVVDVLDNFATEYPDWATQGFEIAGFVWWQGDKDRYNMGYASKYEDNLVNLINSLRSYYSARYPGQVVPNAPFVLATLGQTAEGDTSPSGDVAVFDAQMAVDGDAGNHPSFAGNVKTVYTHPLSQGGSSNGHYNKNAATYMLVGDALGRAMLSLQNDITPPSPVTFAIAPSAVDSTTVGMVATTAIDSSGPVEYFFENTTNSDNSGWITGTRWDNTGLAPGSYDYRFKARDTEGNESGWSSTLAASPGTDVTAPTPDPMGFENVPTATGETSLTMTASTASDINGVEYQFVCTVGGGPDGAWQASPDFSPTGLTPGTLYTYVVRARDSAGNTTADSSAESATTDAPDTTAPTPDPMTFDSPPTATGQDSITMTATTATDPSGVEYRFNNLTNATNSGWQDATVFTDTGLTPGTEYTYTVQARDKSAAQTATAPSAPAAATTEAPDTTPPAVQSYSPVPASTGFPVDGILAVTFDEDIAVGSGNITIKKISDGSTTPVDVTDGTQVSVSGAVLTIDPAANFESDTTYGILIDATAIEDLVGNAFPGISDDTIWRFTTVSPPPAGLLFSEDFESPDVDAAAGNGDTNGTLPDNGNWVGATQGFGASRRGITDKSSGHFSAPDPNMQAFAFRYTNSGLTTAQGKIGPLAADVTYTVSVDVVRDDGRNAGTPYNIELVAFGSGDDDASRRECRAGRPGTVLASSSGNAPSDGAIANVSFDFTPDSGNAHLGKDIGIRFLGATTTAIIDNVSLSSSGGAGGNDFVDWIGGYPGVGTLTGLDDDADDDGVDNGVENYFGTDPSQFTAGLVSGTVNGGAGTFTFTHPLNATPADDLSATYRWSKDLATFHPDGTPSDGTSVSFSQGAPSGGMVTVTATVTGTPLDRLFVDIQVTQAP